MSDTSWTIAMSERMFGRKLKSSLNGGAGQIAGIEVKEDEPKRALTLSNNRIDNVLLKNLLGYWLELILKDGAARKARFDPVALPRDWWPRIFMIDVRQAQPRTVSGYWELTP
jgi:hypothetical protein